MVQDVVHVRLETADALAVQDVAEEAMTVLLVYILQEVFSFFEAHVVVFGNTVHECIEVLITQLDDTLLAHAETREVEDLRMDVDFLPIFELAALHPFFCLLDGFALCPAARQRCDVVSVTVAYFHHVVMEEVRDIARTCTSSSTRIPSSACFVTPSSVCS